MPAQRYDRQAWRCAYQVLDTLDRTREAVIDDHACGAQQVSAQFPQITRTSNTLLSAVGSTRYSAASSLIAQRLRHQLQTVTRDLQLLGGQLARVHSPLVPSLRDLLGELDQLGCEFGNWRYDTVTRALSVTTEGISLEGIALGRFTIHLRLDQPFLPPIGELITVDALEPNPAAANPEVTHPHVSGEGLCVGDSGPDLMRALGEGRLCDCFLIIRSVLRTYNPASPYVSLDEWDGEPCADCDRSVTDDDSADCEGCERRVCHDCITACPHCEASFCYGCITRCRCCEKSSCDDCLAACTDCGDLVCPDCIEDDLCPTCLENRHDQDKEEPTDQDEAAGQEEITAAP